MESLQNLRSPRRLDPALSEPKRRPHYQPQERPVQLGTGRSSLDQNILPARTKPIAGRLSALACMRHRGTRRSRAMTVRLCRTMRLASSLKRSQDTDRRIGGCRSMETSGSGAGRYDSARQTSLRDRAVRLKSWLSTGHLGSELHGAASLEPQALMAWTTCISTTLAARRSPVSRQLDALSLRSTRSPG